MTGSRVAAGNPSRDQPQPVPNPPVTRPPVQPPRDGFTPPVTRENPSLDTWTGSRRTRPDVPKPSERTPHLTDPHNPSHRTTRQTTATPIRRSAHHVPPAPTGTDQPATEPTSGTPDPTGPEEGNRPPRSRPGTTAPRSQTATRRTTRQRKDSHPGRTSDAATANLAATAPTPGHGAPGQAESDEVNARAPALDHDAFYAYHLDRVTKKFKTVISAENLELLARLLGEDDRG